MCKKISIFLLIFIFMSVSFLFGQGFKEADNLIKENGISYDQAITEMKRAFIGGAVNTEKYDQTKWLEINPNLNNKNPNKYSNPFFWAPFVYYGK